MRRSIGRAVAVAGVGLVLLTAGACRVGTKDVATDPGTAPAPAADRSDEPATRDSAGSDSGATDAPRAPVSFTASRSRGTYRCDDQVVDVVGIGNELRLTGACRELDVIGADNTIWVERVGKITVTGSGNQVTWQSGLDGGDPAVFDTSTGSTVGRGSRNAVPGDDGDGGRVLTFERSTEIERVDCEGGVLSVTGSNNQLTAVRCVAVNLSGDNNDVRFDDTGLRKVTFTGDNNTVYAKTQPRVSDTGGNNDVFVD